MDSGKIGAYIQLKRKSAGLTQTQLGDMLGITSKAVSKWETGVAIPDVSLFPELTKILNITMEELLQGEDNKVVPPEKKKRNVIIVLSIILSLVTILLITTIIYFKSNYKKVEVYKLESAKNNFYIEGTLTNTNNINCLSITKLDYLGKDSIWFEQIRSLKYEIYFKDHLIYKDYENKSIKKDTSLVLKNHFGESVFFSCINLGEENITPKDFFVFRLVFEDLNSVNKSLDVIIKMK